MTGARRRGSKAHQASAIHLVDAEQVSDGGKSSLRTEARNDYGFARHANHSRLSDRQHRLSSSFITPGCPLGPIRNIFHGSSSDDTCCSD
jgi:hypothetical protein